MRDVNAWKINLKANEEICRVLAVITAKVAQCVANMKI